MRDLSNKSYNKRSKQKTNNFKISFKACFDKTFLGYMQSGG